MKLIEDTPQNAGKLLAFLEKKIDAGEVDHNVLKVIQRRLDDIEKAQRDGPFYMRFYPVMLEVQALIHLYDGKQDEGGEFLAEAIRKSGGPSSLRSKVLKQYLDDHDLDLDLNVADFSRLSDKERRYLQSYGITESTDLRFFTRQPVALLVLSALTMGLYPIVWFYKNWKAIRDTTGTRLSPFWRAILVVFWVWPLFKIMLFHAKARGVAHNLSAGWLATAYIVIGYLSSGLTYADETYGVFASVAVMLLSVGVLAEVQRKVIDAKPEESRTDYSPYGKGEIVYTVLAAIYFALIIAILMFVSWYDTQSVAAKAKVDSLTAQYDACFGELQAESPYVDGYDQIAIDAYNAKYDECEAVRVRQNQAVDEYNYLVN